LGQFRLVHGVVTKVAGNGWRFELGKLTVTVPKKYRKGFTRGYKIQRGELVLLRGRLRMSKKKQWFLSVHTESDIAHIK